MAVLLSEKLSQDLWLPSTKREEFHVKGIKTNLSYVGNRTIIIINIKNMTI